MTEVEYNLVCNLARLRIINDALRWVHGAAPLNRKVKAIAGKVQDLIDEAEREMERRGLL